MPIRDGWHDRSVFASSMTSGHDASCNTLSSPREQARPHIRRAFLFLGGLRRPPAPRRSVVEFAALGGVLLPLLFLELLVLLTEPRVVWDRLALGSVVG